MRRYRSDDEDSARWARVPLRAGDVVVSTRSKHGTTWVQAILLMLVHGPGELPAPLPVLAPWVDHLGEPVDDLAARLEAQAHRRVVKTHTPLDGVPLHPEVDYVVVARHPLDAAVSLYHQGANIDRVRLAELTGSIPGPRAPRPDLATWLRDWTRAERDPATALDSLQGVAHHLSDAWARRHRPNVTLVHYGDLQVDLHEQVDRLARVTGLGKDRDLADIVDQARFTSMRARADEFVPDATGVLADHGAFFRRGRAGAGRALLDDGTVAAYRARMADLLDPDLDAWLHR